MEISTEEFEDLKYIGEGEEGIVRKKGKYALKRFFELGNYKKVCIEPQYGIVSNSFAFPRQPLFVDGIYIGCTNNFVAGENIDNYKVNDLQEFIKLVKNVELELDLLSDSKITILDLIPRNALINKDGFKVIDTTRYQITDDKYECLCTNTKRLNYFFVKYLLLKDINEDNFMKLVSQNQKLLEYLYSLTYVEAHNHLSAFLERFINEFNIKTIKEYDYKVLTLK